MAVGDIVATDWSIDRSTKVISYDGDDHNGTAPSYTTVINFHRWLQGLADDAVATASTDDELDITNTDPSRRSTDNIITLINGYTIGATEAEHLYDGSIIQSDGDDIWDGIVNFGNAGVVIQVIQDGSVITDDFWNYSIGGTHTGAADASVLTDSTKSWTPDELIGYVIKNTDDVSWGVITDNDATTVTVDLYEGTDNDFDNGDAYLIAKGLNEDTTSGISHRFMVKTTDGGTTTDSGKLIGTTRRFGYTYAEFVINATARGNNVLALADSADLNNETDVDTVGTWSTITNTEAYANIDVDNNSTDEYYYSEWDRDTYTINQFYERMKWLTRDGSASTLYGLNGEVFRGITHQMTLADLGSAQTWVIGEVVSWGSGATAGTGRLISVDDTDDSAATAAWIQLLTGASPSGTLTGATNSATGTISAVVERTISKPFVGASTGSALIGAYGVGVEVADLTSSDKVTDLGNTVITPPNYVTNTVSGLIHGEDRVLVGPWDASSTDTNGDPAIDKGQFVLTSTLSTANVATVQVSTGTETALPTDTPATGTIRVTDDDGYERYLPYSSWTGTTFTLNTGHADMGSNNDFDGVTGSGTYQATAGVDVYIAYIDELATGSTVNYDSLVEGTTYVIKTVGDVNWTSIGATSGTQDEIFTKNSTAATGTSGDAYTYSATATFTSVQSGTRNLVVVVRDGASTPIKQFISSWTQTSSAGSITAIRTTDA